MKNVIVVLFVFLTSIPALADWAGTAKVRYRTFRYDDQLNSADGSGHDRSVQHRKTYDYRASLTYGAKVAQDITGEVGLRTKASATSFYTSAQNLDAAIGLDLANLKWTSPSDKRTSAALGRQKIVFQYDTYAQNVWDNDLRLDGLAGQYGKDAFSIAGAAYVLGAVTTGSGGAIIGSSYTKTAASEAVASTRSGMSYLFGVQPSYTWKTEPLNVTLALARYEWIRAQGFTNRNHAGYNSQTLNPTADTGTVKVDNPRQWHALAVGELPRYDLRAALEWVQNKEMLYGNGDKMDRTAWSGSLNYRKAKQAGDWAASYGYVHKGIASTPGVFSFSDLSPDSRAHIFDLVYMPANQMELGITAFFIKEISQRSQNGTLLPTQNQKARVLFFTAGVKF